ncbi:CBS domain-containing protein [Leptolyngbya ohadii]|uniref:CBS domain-containing protein n=1 Tax=Leptolyngbya ohadii TaxID=1962290 RepID=UPI000B59F395|nr:CBS domain-containing protein [Leptolyngbya ohadii]
MDIILCHTTADFDTLGAAIGLTRLHPGARVVLTGGSHPTVRDFLALHRDEYALIERRSVIVDQIRSLMVVDTQWRERLGKAAEWLDLPGVTVTVYDHHPGTEDNLGGDIAADEMRVEAIGSTTTMIAEQLQAAGILLTSAEATVMALGIHVDTGSLTFDHTTVRDAAALTWLMGQGASLRAIGEYVEPGLSSELQDLLSVALEQMQTETIRGYSIAWVLLPVEGHVVGLSNLASRLLTLTEMDALLLATQFCLGDCVEQRLTVIGRSRGGLGADDLDLGEVLQPWGGGGHLRAASLSMRVDEPEKTFQQIVDRLRQQIPHPTTAREMMSSPVRTIRPETTIGEAQRILLRYGHAGLSVVDAEGQLVGIISRRDIDIALHHGFSHAPVKGYMTTNLRTITPDATLPEIEALMTTFDIGRLPVLEKGQLVGMVTRTDVLRQLHQGRQNQSRQAIAETGETSLRQACVLPDVVQGMLRSRLIPALWKVLMQAAKLAEQRGWQLYVVGGAVRDMLRSQGGEPHLYDIDLVVDGFHRSACPLRERHSAMRSFHAAAKGGSADQAAGVELARALQELYPETKLQIHGRFQTAALLWHNDPELGSLWVDIATARTEFYPYPAANPEVEASSIRQDLYRRDFTINAMAIRLTTPRRGELLDFFGGVIDLEAKQIRVLHANSFIEDPTRIYRAVRFAVRLGFQIEPQTEGYIRHAIASGVYDRIQLEVEKTPALQTRLKQELKYILEAPYWKRAIALLDYLGAICCIHPDLQLTPVLWHELRLTDRWLKLLDRKPTPRPKFLPHWQILLEVMLLHLEPEARVQVAAHFQLSGDSLDRLSQFEAKQALVNERLPQCERPSQVYRLLQPFDFATLTLLAVKSDRPIRRRIWQYLTHDLLIKPLLNGNDLKQLGLKPGRQFKEILEAVFAATLDGVVSDREGAIGFVRGGEWNSEWGQQQGDASGSIGH